MKRVDRQVWNKLMKLRKTHPGWELVFQEPNVEGAPEWKPVVKGTMHKLSDGTLAYLFNAGPPL